MTLEQLINKSNAMAKRSEIDKAGSNPSYNI